jgi:hypothetical protein
MAMNDLLNVPHHVNSDAPALNGRGLAHRKLTNGQRVRLAADLATGQRRLDPSLSQISVMLGVPPAAIRADIKTRAANGNVKRNPAAAALIQAWNDASMVEREEAVRALGPARVWDVLANVIA